MLRPSRRRGVRAGDLRHGPETVKDLAGQADGACELIVDVNGIEVAGGSRVADRQEPVGRHAQLRDVGAGVARQKRLL